MHNWGEEDGEMYTGDDGETHRGGHRNTQVWLTAPQIDRLTEIYRGGAHLKHCCQSINFICKIEKQSITCTFTVWTASSLKLLYSIFLSWTTSLWLQYVTYMDKLTQRWRRGRMSDFGILVKKCIAYLTVLVFTHLSLKGKGVGKPRQGVWKGSYN